MATSSAQELAERLRDVYVSFARDGDRAVARLAELYAVDVVFRDPLQTLRGREAFLALNRRVMARARHLSFDVEAVLGGGDSLLLAWTMTYALRGGRSLLFEGATHARVRGGLIVEQRDYWDLLSSLAQSVPGVRHVYSALARRLG
jgi:ketosteroid isomerase-like protein